MKYGLNQENPYGWYRPVMPAKEMYAACDGMDDALSKVKASLEIIGLAYQGIVGPFLEAHEDGRVARLCDPDCGYPTASPYVALIPGAFRVLLPYYRPTFLVGKPITPPTTPFMDAPIQTVELLVWPQWCVVNPLDPECSPYSERLRSKMIWNAASEIMPDYFGSAHSSPTFRASWVRGDNSSFPGQDRGDSSSSNITLCLWDALCRIRHGSGREWAVIEHGGSEAGHYRSPYRPVDPPSKDAWFYKTRYKTWRHRAIGHMILIADELMGRNKSERGGLSLADGEHGEVSLV